MDFILILTESGDRGQETGSKRRSEQKERQNAEKNMGRMEEAGSEGGRMTGSRFRVGCRMGRVKLWGDGIQCDRDADHYLRGRIWRAGGGADAGG